MLDSKNLYSRTGQSAEQELVAFILPLSRRPSGTLAQSAKRETQQRFLTRIPDVLDLQASWLVLHFGAVPRAKYLLRTVPSALTARIAADHDAAVATCLGSRARR